MTREIDYRIEVLPEDIEVRGNLIASGDETYDRNLENEVLARLERGDEWAWCVVRVIASADGFEGDAYLGGCSYRDEADFKAPGGYFEDMKNEAKADLLETLRHASETLHRLTP